MVKEMEKGDRILPQRLKRNLLKQKILQHLAKEMESKFNTKAIISLEFGGITAEALKEAGLARSKIIANSHSRKILPKNIHFQISSDDMIPDVRIGRHVNQTS